MIIFVILLLIFLCIAFGYVGAILITEWKKPEKPMIEIFEENGFTRLYFSEDVVVECDDKKQTLNDIRETNGLSRVEDPHTIEVGDRHMDTMEKSFNDSCYPKESWKYTFENGESTNSNHPLSYDELKPFVDKNGPVKSDGLEVIKS